MRRAAKQFICLYKQNVRQRDPMNGKFVLNIGVYFAL